MWCRLVSGEATAAARPLSWGNGIPGLPAPARPLFSAPDSPDYAQDSLSDPRGQESSAEAYQRGLRDGEAAALDNASEAVTAKLRQIELSIEQLALHRMRRSEERRVGKECRCRWWGEQ